MGLFSKVKRQELQLICAYSIIYADSDIITYTRTTMLVHVKN